MVAPVRSWPDVVPAPNRTLGWAVLAWTADYLLQPDGPDAGDPWRFTREQTRMILRWYEIDDAGKFLHRRGVIRRMKGWGKDPFLAVIAAVELCGPCRFGGWNADGTPIAVPHAAAWIQVSAVAMGQTRNTMTLFPGIFSKAAIADFGIELNKEIIHTRAGGRIEAVTQSPRVIEGARPTLAILNESHHWLSNNEGVEMADAIRRNLGKSRDGSARSMEITNAHMPGEGSVAETTFEAWQAAVAKGKTLAGVYYDSVEAPMRRDADGEPVPIPLLTDDELREGLLAARGDSVWLDPQRVLDEIRDPATPQSKARRFYLNQVAAAEESWVDPPDWAACKGAPPLDPGEMVALGFDGSLFEDSTALVACRISDGALFPLAVWEKPDGPRGQSWKVPLVQVDAAVDDAFRVYDVLLMYADPPHYRDSVERWSLTYGETVVVEFWTNRLKAMGLALLRLHTDIRAHRPIHEGTLVLTAHVGNAVSVETASGTQIRKRRQGDKIDVAVAATLAYEARAIAVAEGLNERSSGGWMVSV